ncbi:hypothetical protein K438DRAFT_1957321 [Mycena galopus ATCC 62051]|nr:hypothetical protein K438DRAFT_1957321 [Mycena galopus ATCC 62051]
MPTITIFGATGTQRCVDDALWPYNLSSMFNQALPYSKPFSPMVNTPRAALRSLHSDKSKALLVRVGNFWEKEPLETPIRGSEASLTQCPSARNQQATNFWDPEIFPADPEGKGELAPGNNLVGAAKESFTWIAQDFGTAVLTLLTNYGDPSKDVVGKIYSVLTMRVTYPEFAAPFAAVIKKDVTFTPLEITGIKIILLKWFVLHLCGGSTFFHFTNPTIAFGSKD